MDTSCCMSMSGHDDAISPLTDSSDLTMSVSATTVSTATNTPLSQPETPIYRPGERKIDYECFPEVVPSNDPEPAVLENAGTGFNLPELACTYTHELQKQAVTTYAGLEVSTSLEPSNRDVTPLHLLGDQPDWIDCPFCERRARTTIKKKPSNLTHIQAAFLLVATGPGVAVPYAAKWCFNVEQYCGNCDNRVAYLSRGKDLFICREARR